MVAALTAAHGASLTSVIRSHRGTTARHVRALAAPRRVWHHPWFAGAGRASAAAARAEMCASAPRCAAGRRAREGGLALERECARVAAEAGLEEHIVCGKKAPRSQIRRRLLEQVWSGSLAVPFLPRWVLREGKNRPNHTNRENQIRESHE